MQLTKHNALNRSNKKTYQFQNSNIKLTKKIKSKHPSCTAIFMFSERGSLQTFPFPWRSKMAAVNGHNFLEMKRQAVAYYSENKVPEHVEKLLNDMFKEKPEDIYGYMVRFRSKTAKFFGECCRI